MENKKTTSIFVDSTKYKIHLFHSRQCRGIILIKLKYKLPSLFNFYLWEIDTPRWNLYPKIHERWPLYKFDAPENREESEPASWSRRIAPIPDLWPSTLFRNRPTNVWIYVISFIIIRFQLDARIKSITNDNIRLNAIKRRSAWSSIQSQINCKSSPNKLFELK